MEFSSAFNLAKNSIIILKLSDSVQPEGACRVQVVYRSFFSIAFWTFVLARSGALGVISHGT